MININYVKPCETFVSMAPADTRLADATLQETLNNGRWTPVEGFEHTMGTRDGLTLPIALLRQNQQDLARNLIDTLGHQFLNLGSFAGAPLLTEILCRFQVPEAQRFANSQMEGLIYDLLGYGVDINIATTQEFVSPIGSIPAGATPLWILAEKIQNSNLTSSLLFFGAQVGQLSLSSEAEVFLTEIGFPGYRSREIIRNLAPGAYTITNFIKTQTTPEELDQEIIRVNRDVVVQFPPREPYRPEFGGRLCWTALESCLEYRNIPLAYHLLDRYGGHLIRAPRVFPILESSKSADGSPLRAFTDEEILGIVNRCPRENLVYLGIDLLDYCLKNGKENSALALLERGTIPVNPEETNEIIRKNSWASPFWPHLLKMMKEDPKEASQYLYNFLIVVGTLPDELLAKIGLYLQPKGVTLLSQHFKSTKELVESEETKEST